MASKLKKDIGQPAIKGYLGDNPAVETKKRTPLSLEKNPKKRLNLESSEEEASVIKIPEKEVKDDPHSSSVDESEDSDSVNSEESAFEKHLTKTLSKLMKKELQSIKKD